MPPVISLRTVTNNVGWSLLSKTSTFGLKFVTVPILARLLTPEEFGIVAVAQAIVLFLGMIGGAGLAASLVIEKTEDATAIHTVFWSNLAVALAVAACLVAFGEPIARLLGAPGGGDVLRVLALIIPIQLCGDVAYALLARRMAFSRDAFWSVSSESAAALLAVTLAFAGFGLWALVAQLFAAAIIRLGGLLHAANYRPRAIFSFGQLTRLWRFSVPLMGSEVFNFVTFQSPLVIIARTLGVAPAGAFSAANRFANIPNQVVLAGLMGVLFPTFSRMAGEHERRRNALSLSTQLCTITLAPMMFGIWAVAEPGMLVIFGEKWVWAWPVLGLLAISKGILSPCSTFIPYLKGIGESRLLWWIALARATLVVTAVTTGALTGGLVAAVVWLCVANALTLLVYSAAIFRVNGTPFTSGFLVACRPMASALAMAIMVRLLVEYLAAEGHGAVFQIVAGGLAGALIYATMTAIVERAFLRRLFQLVREAFFARPRHA